MNKQILSVAIALPIVLVSAGQSLASDAVRISQVTTTPVTADILKPTLPKSTLPDVRAVNTQQGPNDVIVPGPGVVVPPPPPPPPPWKERLLQNQNGVVAPGLNSSPQNLNINVDHR